GAHVLAESINERLRNSPEAMNTIMTSIRESTDTLGLSSSGKHAEKSRLPVVAAVALGVLLLLTIVLWALLGRWGVGRSHPCKAGVWMSPPRNGVGPAGFEPAL